MRGDDRRPEALFSYVSPEERIPPDHPLRAIREMVDSVLHELSPRFAKLYSSYVYPHSFGLEFNMTWLRQAAIP